MEPVRPDAGALDSGQRRLKLERSAGQLLKCRPPVGSGSSASLARRQSFWESHWPARTRGAQRRAEQRPRTALRLMSCQLSGWQLSTISSQTQLKSLVDPTQLPPGSHKARLSESVAVLTNAPAWTSLTSGFAPCRHGSMASTTGVPSVVEPVLSLPLNPCHAAARGQASSAGATESAPLRSSTCR